MPTEKKEEPKVLPKRTTRSSLADKSAAETASSKVSENAKKKITPGSSKVQVEPKARTRRTSRASSADISPTRASSVDKSPPSKSQSSTLSKIVEEQQKRPSTPSKTKVQDDVPAARTPKRKGGASSNAASAAVASPVRITRRSVAAIMEVFVPLKTSPKRKSRASINPSSTASPARVTRNSLAAQVEDSEGVAERLPTRSRRKTIVPDHKPDSDVDEQENEMPAVAEVEESQPEKKPEDVGEEAKSSKLPAAEKTPDQVSTRSRRSNQSGTSDDKTPDSKIPTPTRLSRSNTPVSSRAAADCRTPTQPSNGSRPSTPRSRPATPKSRPSTPLSKNITDLKESVKSSPDRHANCGSRGSSPVFVSHDLRRNSFSSPRQSPRSSPSRQGRLSLGRSKDASPKSTESKPTSPLVSGGSQTPTELKKGRTSRSSPRTAKGANLEESAVPEKHYLEDEDDTLMPNKRRKRDPATDKGQAEASHETETSPKKKLTFHTEPEQEVASDGSSPSKTENSSKEEAESNESIPGISQSNKIEEGVERPQPSTVSDEDVIKEPLRAGSGEPGVTSLEASKESVTESSAPTDGQKISSPHRETLARNVLKKQDTFVIEETLTNEGDSGQVDGKQSAEASEEKEEIVGSSKEEGGIQCPVLDSNSPVGGSGEVVGEQPVAASNGMEKENANSEGKRDIQSSDLDSSLPAGSKAENADGGTVEVEGSLSSESCEEKLEGVHTSTTDGSIQCPVLDSSSPAEISSTENAVPESGKIEEPSAETSKEKEEEVKLSEAKEKIQCPDVESGSQFETLSAENADGGSSDVDGVLSSKISEGIGKEVKTDEKPLATVSSSPVDPSAEIADGGSSDVDGVLSSKVSEGIEKEVKTDEKPLATVNSSPVDPSAENDDGESVEQGNSEPKLPLLQEAPEGNSSPENLKNELDNETDQHKMDQSVICEDKKSIPAVVSETKVDSNSVEEPLDDGGKGENQQLKQCGVTDITDIDPVKSEEITEDVITASEGSTNKPEEVNNSEKSMEITSDQNSVDNQVPEQNEVLASSVSLEKCPVEHEGNKSPGETTESKIAKQCEVAEPPSSDVIVEVKSVEDSTKSESIEGKIANQSEKSDIPVQELIDESTKTDIEVSTIVDQLVDKSDTESTSVIPDVTHDIKKSPDSSLKQLTTDNILVDEGYSETSDSEYQLSGKEVKVPSIVEGLGITVEKDRSPSPRILYDIAEDREEEGVDQPQGVEKSKLSISGSEGDQMVSSIITNVEASQEENPESPLGLALSPDPEHTMDDESSKDVEESASSKDVEESASSKDVEESAVSLDEKEKVEEVPKLTSDSEVVDETAFNVEEKTDNLEKTVVGSDFIDDEAEEGEETEEENDSDVELLDESNFKIDQENDDDDESSEESSVNNESCYIVEIPDDKNKTETSEESKLSSDAQRNEEKTETKRDKVDDKSLVFDESCSIVEIPSDDKQKTETAEEVKLCSESQRNEEKTVTKRDKVDDESSVFDESCYVVETPSDDEQKTETTEASKLCSDVKTETKVDELGIQECGLTKEQKISPKAAKPVFEVVEITDTDVSLKTKEPASGAASEFVAETKKNVEKIISNNSKKSAIYASTAAATQFVVSVGKHQKKQSKTKKSEPLRDSSGKSDSSFTSSDLEQENVRSLLKIKKRPAADEVLQESKKSKLDNAPGFCGKLCNIAPNTSIAELKEALMKFGIASGLLSLEFCPRSDEQSRTALAIYNSQKNLEKALSNYGKVNVRGRQIFFLLDDETSQHNVKDQPIVTSPKKNLKKKKFVGIICQLPENITIGDIYCAYEAQGVKSLKAVKLYRNRASKTKFAKLEFSKRTALFEAIIVSDNIVLHGNKITLKIKEKSSSP